MRSLSLAPFAPLAGLTPLAVRLIVGIIVFAHGLQKLTQGPANFGQNTLGGLGVPLPVLMGYMVTIAGQRGATRSPHAVEQQQEASQTEEREEPRHQEDAHRDEGEQGENKGLLQKIKDKLMGE